MWTEPPDAGGAVTCSVAVPAIVPDVAVIVASPAPTAVARPDVGSTVATLGALDVQAIEVLTACPAASSAVAVNCCVAPAVIVAVDGTTAIDATGPTTMTSASLHVPK